MMKTLKLSDKQIIRSFATEEEKGCLMPSENFSDGSGVCFYYFVFCINKITLLNSRLLYLGWLIAVLGVDCFVVGCV